MDTFDYRLLPSDLSPFGCRLYHSEKRNSTAKIITENIHNKEIAKKDYLNLGFFRKVFTTENNAIIFADPLTSVLLTPKQKNQSFHGATSVFAERRKNESEVFHNERVSKRHFG